MYQRAIANEIMAMAAHFPIVTVIGPRQSGKTTLTRHLFANKPYISLEKLDEREFAELDPIAFLGQFPDGAILDEIQRVPSLLSYLQTIVDENPKAGQFILTGSHQLKLHEAISQSLAGRTAILKLLPMSIDELSQSGISYSQNEYLLRGGYPKLQKENLTPAKYYNFYCQTYLEKDVRQIINVKDLHQFQRFMRLCAARVGCTINASSIAGELGISTPTAKQWLSVLEASHLIFFIPPYFENFGKRIIKTPRLYFTDVGLASYLLGIETEQQMLRDPLRGNLHENLVVLELLKARYNIGLEPHLYFYRDSSQLEVDLIYQKGHQLVIAEIKSSKTFNREFIKNILQFKKIAKDRVEKSYLIYAGDTEQPINDVSVINYKNSQLLIE